MKGEGLPNLSLPEKQALFKQQATIVKSYNSWPLWQQSVLGALTARCYVPIYPRQRISQKKLSMFLNIDEATSNFSPNCLQEKLTVNLRALGL